MEIELKDKFQPVFNVLDFGVTFILNGSVYIKLVRAYKGESNNAWDGAKFNCLNVTEDNLELISGDMHVDPIDCKLVEV